MNVKYIFISVCLLFPIMINAQEFVRADNIHDLIFLADNGDSVRSKSGKPLHLRRRYHRNDIRIHNTQLDALRHKAVPDSLSDIIMANDTIQVLSYEYYPLNVYNEAIYCNNTFYEWGNTETMECVIISGELSNRIDPSLLASDFQHIIAGEIVFTDSIPSRAEKMYLNKFIRMLPGVYEHTRYIYATDDLSYIYYGPMDRE